MVIFLRIIKWISVSILGVVVFIVLLIALDSDAESIELSKADREVIRHNVQKLYEPLTDSSEYDRLLATCGQSKGLPKGYEWPCLLALSHYPELVDTPIDFVVEPAFLPLASRPDPITVLLPWIERKYLVVISNQSEAFFEPILFENLPLNEQVGVVGHELSHTVYYRDKHSFHLAWVAYQYQNNGGFRLDFERDTDKRAIAHGVGYQMYDYAFFVRKAFGDTKEEIEMEEGDMYLSPNEIAAEMEKYDFYKDSLDGADVYFGE